MFDYELTMQRAIKGNTIIEYNDTNPNESYVKCLLCDPVQRLLGLFKRIGERKERDATALKIDFYRDCYGNHSTSSTECPFCPLGLDCRQEETVINKGHESNEIRSRFGGVQK